MRMAALIGWSIGEQLMLTDAPAGPGRRRIGSEGSASAVAVAVPRARQRPRMQTPGKRWRLQERESVETRSNEAAGVELRMQPEPRCRAVRVLRRTRRGRGRLGPVLKVRTPGEGDEGRPHEKRTTTARSRLGGGAAGGACRAGEREITGCKLLPGATSHLCCRPSRPHNSLLTPTVTSTATTSY